VSETLLRFILLGFFKFPIAFTLLGHIYP